MTSSPRPAAQGPAAPDAEQPEAETRMRRALGLLPGGRGGPPGRRPETTVAVEHRGGRGQGVNRVAVAETALVEERKRREQAERERDEAKIAMHEMQTKFGHAELARDEAMAARDAAIAARDEALAALEAERSAREVAVAEPKRPPDRSEADAPPRRRGRPPKVPAPAVEEEDLPEGEPVQWWAPGWRG
jgi:hypothetical protein